MQAHFILYVADQKASTAFYSLVLDTSPRLDVPGMTEFSLGSRSVLGLMPETSAANLLGHELFKPNRRDNTPRAEIYLIVDDPAAFHERAINAGARELSPLKRPRLGTRRRLQPRSQRTCSGICCRKFASQTYLTGITTLIPLLAGSPTVLCSNIRWGPNR